MAQERFLEFIRALVNYAAAPDDWAEVEVRLPVSENENLACLIHQVEMQVGSLAGGLAGGTAVHSAHLALRSAPPGTVWDIWNVGVICAHLYAIYSNVADDVKVRFGTKSDNQLATFYFDPPVLIAQNLIYLAAGNFDISTAASYGACRIGYTLEKVTREAFIAALVRFL